MGIFIFRILAHCQNTLVIYLGVGYQRKHYYCGGKFHISSDVISEEFLAMEYF